MQEYRYDAFISYRHREMDMAVAKRLQQLLENHKKPDGTTVRVFRDQSDLPTDSDLHSDIRHALEQSRFLILLCSKAYGESRYCMEELACFLQLQGGSNRHVLTLLLEGEPGDVFPAALFTQSETVRLPDGTTQTIKREVEPLAADVRGESIPRQLKKLKTEYLRIAAPLLGCGFDDLYQRTERKRKRRILTYSCALILLLSAFCVYSMYMLNQITQRQRQLEQKQSELYANESRRLSDEAIKLMEENPNLAMALADLALPDSLDQPEYPVVPSAARALGSMALYAQISERTEGLRLNAVIDADSSSAVFSADGSRMALRKDNDLYVFDARTAQLLQVIASDSIITFSADMGKYYLIADRFEAGEYRKFACVYDTLSGELRAQYPVLEGDDTKLRTMFYDERTDRVYIAYYAYCVVTKNGRRMTSLQLTPYGYIDASDRLVRSDELPDEETRSALKNAQPRWTFDVEAQDAAVAISAQLGSDYTLGQIQSVWDGSLYLVPVSLWEEVGTFDDQDDRAYSLLDEAMSSDDIRIEHHPLNVPSDYFELYAENGLELQRIDSDEVTGTFTVYQRSKNQTALWDVQGKRMLSVLDGTCFQPAQNHLLFGQRDDGLYIYSYYPESFSDVQIDSMASSDAQPRYMLLSPDGSRTARMQGDELLLFDAQHLSEPSFRVNTGYAYTMTKDFRFVLVKDEHQRLTLYETDGGQALLSLAISGNSAESFCVDDDGSRVAVATPQGNRLWQVDVYDVQSGRLVQSFAAEDIHSGNGAYLALSGNRLCVSFDSNIWLYDLAQIDHPEFYDTRGSSESAFQSVFPVASPFKKDGKLILPGMEQSVYGDRYRINSIIDTKNHLVKSFYSRYEGGAESFCYDEKSETLIDQATNVFVVQRPNEEGHYEEVFRITAQDSCRQILWGAEVCDGEHLVVNGDHQTEIYSMKDGTLAYVFPHSAQHQPYYILRDGVLYDLNSQNEQLTRYPLPDLEQARAIVFGYLSEFGPTRTITEGERNRYYIPAEWQ